MVRYWLTAAEWAASAGKVEVAGRHLNTALATWARWLLDCDPSVYGNVDPLTIDDLFWNAQQAMRGDADACRRMGTAIALASAVLEETFDRAKGGAK